MATSHKILSNIEYRADNQCDFSYYPRESTYPKQYHYVSKDSYLEQQDFQLKQHMLLQVVGREENETKKENYQADYPDLLALEARKPKVPPLLPTLGQTVTSPLLLHNWSSALKNHPDHAFVEYILWGIAHGFHIGFDRSTKCISATNNMRSALQNPEPVDEYLAVELHAGRIVGPLNADQVKNAQISRFGVIPKAGQPNKWRLILDLSSPRGHSVNDGIDKELCSLKYASVEDAVQTIWSLGQGTLLAKIDIEHAYRNIPVHTDDRLLLAMQWRNNLYNACLVHCANLAPLRILRDCMLLYTLFYTSNVHTSPCFKAVSANVTFKQSRSASETAQY